MKQSELLIKNFAAGFFRTAVMIVIGFFLTRILVNQMGLEVFGLFTTIGASGMFLALVTDTMQLSVAREFGVRIGEGDSRKLAEAFSSAFFIQLACGLIVLVTGLVCSQWIVARLIIPDGYAQTTTICLTLIFLQITAGIVTSPFGGLIRAHQDISTISALQLAGRVAVFVSALSIMLIPSHKLLTFVSLSLICNVAVCVGQTWVSLRRYPESKPAWRLFSLDVAKSIFRYGSMAFLGTVGGQLRRNGIAVVLNIYFGNLVAAANGIALRLSGLTGQFVGIIAPAIQAAMNMNQGSGNKAVTHRLVTLSSTIGMAVVLPIVVPLLTDTASLLQFWLGVPPPKYAVLFTQIIAIPFAASMLSKGYAMAMHARGQIGWLTTINQLLVILGISVGSLIACSSGERPWLLLVGEVVGVILATWLWQPVWASRCLKFSIKSWLHETLLPTLAMLVGIVGTSLGLTSYLETSVLRGILLSAISGIVCFVVLWSVGLRKHERQQLTETLRIKSRAMAPSLFASRKLDARN